MPCLRRRPQEQSTALPMMAGAITAKRMFVVVCSSRGNEAIPPVCSTRLGVMESGGFGLTAAAGQSFPLAMAGIPNLVDRDRDTGLQARLAVFIAPPTMADETIARRTCAAV